PMSGGRSAPAGRSSARSGTALRAAARRSRAYRHSVPSAACGTPCRRTRRRATRFLTLPLSQALRHHPVGVLAEIGDGGAALEAALHQRLAHRVVPAPHAERLGEARRQGRVGPVEGDDLVRQKDGIGSARLVKSQLFVYKNSTWRAIN